MGWSQEIDGQWAKLDVVIQEIDIQRVFAENELDPRETPRLTGVEAFRLMEAMAEINIMVHQMTQFSKYYNTPENKIMLQGYANTKATILQAVSARIQT